MTAKKSGLFALLFFCFLSIGQASDALKPWFSTDSKHQVSLRVDVFMASTCPYCQKAEAFFDHMQITYPWLDIHRYVINQDKAALDKFYQFLKQNNQYDFAVPSIVFCNTRWVGFDNANHEGQLLVNAMAYCRAQIIKSGYLSAATQQTLKKMAAANWYQTHLDTNQNALLFTAIMALLDAVTPVTIMAALALSAFLFILKPYKRSFLMVSSFLIAIASLHYMQQMHLAFFNNLLPSLKIPMLLATVLLLMGLGYLYAIYFRRIETKRFFLSWLMMLIMALIMPLYQQEYTPNFALIFRQWLEAKSLSPMSFDLYLALYQVIYILAIALLVRSFIATGHYIRRVVLVTEFCWHYLLMLSVVLIVWPLFLVSFMAPFVMILLALISSQVSHRLLYPK